MKEIIS